MHDDLIMKESGIDYITTAPQRRTNRAKLLGYGVYNPRSKTGDHQTNCHRVSNSYITLLEEKLRTSADYVERRVRMYIYRTLYNNKASKEECIEDLPHYRIYYGRYLDMGRVRKLKTSELGLFNEIEDMYFSDRETFDEFQTEPFISVERKMDATIRNHRKKLKDEMIGGLTCGILMCPDLNIANCTTTPVFF